MGVYSPPHQANQGASPQGAKGKKEETMEQNTLRASGSIDLYVPEDQVLFTRDRLDILSRIEELKCRLEYDFPHIAFCFKANHGLTWEGIEVTPEELEALEEREHAARREAETDAEATSVRY
jgi:hypothetical protein